MQAHLFIILRLIIMCCAFEDSVYWHFFTIAVNYYSSHIELLLNDVCLTNLSEESLTDLYYSRIHE
jgi:hypothetical protein